MNRLILKIEIIDDIILAHVHEKGIKHWACYVPINKDSNFNNISIDSITNNKSRTHKILYDWLHETFNTTSINRLIANERQNGQYNNIGVIKLLRDNNISPEQLLSLNDLSICNNTQIESNDLCLLNDTKYYSFKLCNTYFKNDINRISIYEIATKLRSFLNSKIDINDRSDLHEIKSSFINKINQGGIYLKSFKINDINQIIYCVSSSMKYAIRHGKIDIIKDGYDSQGMMIYQLVIINDNNLILAKLEYYYNGMNILYKKCYSCPYDKIVNTYTEALLCKVKYFSLNKEERNNLKQLIKKGQL